MASESSRRRVLLAEDDPTTAAMIRQGLEKAGYAVELVVDGGIAERRLRMERFDAFVTDWMMPQLDGIELVRRMRTVPERPYMVIISALGIPAAHTHALEAGADAFLAKPFSPANLVGLLAAAKPPPIAAIVAPAGTTRETPLAATNAWKRFSETMRQVMADTIQAPVGIQASAAKVADTDVVALCSLVDAEHFLEISLLVSGSEAAVAALGKVLLDDESIGLDALGELANIAAGKLKTELGAESYPATISLYQPTTAATRAATIRASTGRQAVGLVSGNVSVCVILTARTSGAVEIASEQLYEGLVLAEDLANDRGALVLPAGTRLTSAAVRRVREHLAGRRVRVCVPKAA